ncbi:hypothetical protein QIS99_17500 [Streptomyces sp. B-S-A8]|uniref:Uncharacterized protein n=1 Tax=Streptomyces solicavernae TaxID=3043614 RepID=A0ABT6RU67_9ACTN|nr:hypothetical protein [Streptomyces sp. B-S-A8]MDI3387981.1 hypothetical protein [Streptomyces sp. B-S-A8]
MKSKIRRGLLGAAVLGTVAFVIPAAVPQDRSAVPQSGQAVAAPAEESVARPLTCWSDFTAAIDIC